MQNDKEIESLKEQVAILKQLVDVQKKLISSLEKVQFPTYIWPNKPIEYPAPNPTPLSPYQHKKFYCNTTNPTEDE